MDYAAVEALVDTVLAAVDNETHADPASLTFLLRCYGASDRFDVREALEPALAHALDYHVVERDTTVRAAWLTLFAGALPLSADDRLPAAARALACTLRDGWRASSGIAARAVSVDACLCASRTIDLDTIVAEAVDELERLVAVAYRPGEGLVQDGSVHDAGGLLANHIAAASALLTGFDVSGRIPYAMLAEELAEFSRRRWWNDDSGCFGDDALDGPVMFRLNCEAARVLCRLAALHADQAYRAAAVIGARSACGDDAGRILRAHASVASDSGAAAAAYGLALVDWLDLQSPR